MKPLDKGKREYGGMELLPSSGKEAPAPGKIWLQPGSRVVRSGLDGDAETDEVHGCVASSDEEGAVTVVEGGEMVAGSVWEIDVVSVAWSDGRCDIASGFEVFDDDEEEEEDEDGGGIGAFEPSQTDSFGTSNDAPSSVEPFIVPSLSGCITWSC